MPDSQPGIWASLLLQPRGFAPAPPRMAQSSLASLRPGLWSGKSPPSPCSDGGSGGPHCSINPPSRRSLATTAACLPSPYIALLLYGRDLRPVGMAYFFPAALRPLASASSGVVLGEEVPFTLWVRSLKVPEDPMGDFG